MLSCWEDIPSSRPSFTGLKGTFDNLISTSTDNAYIDIMADLLDDAYYASDSINDVIGNIGDMDDDEQVS